MTERLKFLEALRLRVELTGSTIIPGDAVFEMACHQCPTRLAKVLELVNQVGVLSRGKLTVDPDKLAAAIDA